MSNKRIGSRDAQLPFKMPQLKDPPDLYYTNPGCSRPFIPAEEMHDQRTSSSSSIAQGSRGLRTPIPSHKSRSTQPRQDSSASVSLQHPLEDSVPTTTQFQKATQPLALESAPVVPHAALPPQRNDAPSRLMRVAAAIPDAVPPLPLSNVDDRGASLSTHSNETLLIAQPSKKPRLIKRKAGDEYNPPSVCHTVPGSSQAFIPAHEVHSRHTSSSSSIAQEIPMRSAKKTRPVNFTTQPLVQKSASVVPKPVQPNDDVVLSPVAAVIADPMLPPQLTNAPPAGGDRDGSSIDPALFDRMVQMIVARSAEAGWAMVGSNASAAYNDGPILAMMTSVMNRCNTIDVTISNQNARINSMVGTITRIVTILRQMTSADAGIQRSLQTVTRIQRSLETVTSNNLAFSGITLPPRHTATPPPAKS